MLSPVLAILCLGLHLTKTVDTVFQLSLTNDIAGTWLLGQAKERKCTEILENCYVVLLITVKISKNLSHTNFDDEFIQLKNTVVQDSFRSRIPLQQATFHTNLYNCVSPLPPSAFAIWTCGTFFAVVLSTFYIFGTILFQPFFEDLFAFCTPRRPFHILLHFARKLSILIKHCDLRNGDLLAYS